MDPCLMTRGVLHGVPCMYEVIVELYRIIGNIINMIEIQYMGGSREFKGFHGTSDRPLTSLDKLLKILLNSRLA